jgi:metal-dependent amidase/aminoacylase/carboxypeptidase family protein
VLERVPGAMFFLGVAAEGSDWRKCCSIHSPRMVVDEAALPRGAALLAETAKATAAAYGIEATVEIREGFPVTICDERAVALGRAVHRARVIVRYKRHSQYIPVPGALSPDSPEYKLPLFTLQKC